MRICIYKSEKDRESTDDFTEYNRRRKLSWKYLGHVKSKEILFPF